MSKWTIEKVEDLSLRYSEIMEMYFEDSHVVVKDLERDVKEALMELRDRLKESYPNRIM